MDINLQLPQGLDQNSSPKFKSLQLTNTSDNQIGYIYQQQFETTIYPRISSISSLGGASFSIRTSNLQYTVAGGTLTFDHSYLRTLLRTEGGTSSNGLNTNLVLTNTYNHAGTGQSADLQIIRIETALGTGKHHFIRAGNSTNQEIYSVSNSGTIYQSGGNLYQPIFFAASYILNRNNRFCIYTGVGGHSLTMLHATGLGAYQYVTIKNKSTGQLTVDATSLGQIFNTSLGNTHVLSAGGFVNLYSDSINWLVV